MEPVALEDLKKGIIVPKEIFEAELEGWDWTWHQLARGEFVGIADCGNGHQNSIFLKNVTGVDTVISKGKTIRRCYHE